MAEDDRSADIEDIAEDAVNELLGMYGYEGVRKDELKSSLRKRRMPFNGNELLANRPYHHPYLSLPVNTLLLAATSTATSVRSATGRDNRAVIRDSKGSKPNTHSTSAAACSNFATVIGAAGGTKNLQLCQWCKKEKAQITETLPPPTSSSDVSLSATLVSGGKLRFCSSACLNAYKLDIFRRETEACLRASNAVSTTSLADDSIVQVEKAVSMKKSKGNTSENTSKKINSQKIRFKNEQITTSSSTHSAPTDLWTSAVGSGKKLSGRSSSTSKSDQRDVMTSEAKSNSNDGTKLILTNADTSKQQPRPKKRSTSSRPHPYYALNKKYWMTIKGGDSRLDETRDKEESSTGDTAEDSGGSSSTTTATLPLNDVLPFSKAESKQDERDSASREFEAPSEQIVTKERGKDNEKLLEAVSTTSKNESKTNEDETAINSATSAITPAPLTSLVSLLPLNLVWIPVPVPIPLPIPIPIPLPGIRYQRNEDTREMTPDDIIQD